MYITPAEQAASIAANQYTSQPAPQAASGLPTATNTAAGTQAIKDYVSQVMAMGGISDEQKSQMIRSQAYATGTTPEQIAAATGFGLDKVNAYMGLSQAPSAPTQAQITAAEQQARQAHMDMGMEGRKQGLDPETLRTLYSTNAQGQVVRNSDQYAAPFSLNQISNPNAREYYAQNPQELFALGALGGGGGQGYFMDAGVRGTDKKMGQLTPDQYYQGYTSGFQDNWMDSFDPNYRYAAQQSATGAPASSGGNGGSGSAPGGSTGGTGGIVGGMFTDYMKRPPNAGIPSDYNPNQAGAGGTSSDYYDQLNSYYKSYFGDASMPNMNTLKTWYDGGYTPQNGLQTSQPSSAQPIAGGTGNMTGGGSGNNIGATGGSTLGAGVMTDTINKMAADTFKKYVALGVTPAAAMALINKVMAESEALSAINATDDPIGALINMQNVFDAELGSAVSSGGSTGKAPAFGSIGNSSFGEGEY